MYKHYNIRPQYNKKYNNINYRNTDKLIKIQEDKRKKYLNYCNTTIKNNNLLHDKSKEAHKKLKIQTLSLGFIYSTCKYVLNNNKILHVSMWCDICNTFLDWYSYKNPCYNKNNYVAVCADCRKNIDVNIYVIKSAIIRKLVYMRHILRTLLLQDLYIDIIVDYYVMLLQYNSKTLDELFCNRRDDLF